MKRRYVVAVCTEVMDYTAFFESAANTKAGLVRAAKAALNVRFGSAPQPEFWVKPFDDLGKALVEYKASVSYYQRQADYFNQWED
jgi:hypothetical protein